MNGPAFQIFGRRDCPDSRKAERWFKDRGMPFQFVDLKIKGLSPGEFDLIARNVGAEALVNRDSKEFKVAGLQAASPASALKKAKENSLLLKTPMVRRGQKAVLGFKPEIWEAWT